MNQAPTPRPRDDHPSDHAEQVTTVELLPVAPSREHGGKGMAIAALILSVLASGISMGALGLVLYKKPQQAEEIERQRVIDRALDRLEKQMAIIQAEGGTGTAPDPALTARLTDLDARMTSLAEAQASQKIQSDRLDRLNEDFQPLLASLGSIEQRLRQAEKRLNERNTAHLTAIMVTSSDLMANLRAGADLTNDISLLARLAGDDSGLRDLVTRLQPYAGQPLPNMDGLADMLEEQTGKALAALKQDPDRPADWWQDMQNQFRSMVTIRKHAGDVEGDDPAAMLARAAWRVRQHDLDAAVKIVETLPRPVRMTLDRWLDKAHARLQAEDITRQLLAYASDRALESDAPHPDNAPGAVP